jgi:hypothetical protein
MQTTTVMYHSQLPGGVTGLAFEYDGAYLFATPEDPRLHLIDDLSRICLGPAVPASMATFFMETLFAGRIEQLGGTQ